MPNKEDNGNNAMEGTADINNIMETLKKLHKDLEKKTLRHIYGNDVPWSDSIKKVEEKSEEK